MQFYQNCAKVAQFSKADALREKGNSTGEHSGLSLSGNTKAPKGSLVVNSN